MEDKPVSLSVKDGIATITLSRPDRMNALSVTMRNELSDTLDKIKDMENARCIVIEGEGRAFCAGGDVKSQHDKLGEDDESNRIWDQRLISHCENTLLKIYNNSLPTIAKIDGYCLGAGMGLAFACDIQLASENARFGLVFRNVGLSLDFATSYLIPRIIGPNITKELALTGEIIDDQRAVSIGLVNHVYAVEEFEEKSTELINQIANGPTVALYHSTKNIDRNMNNCIRDSIELEAAAQNITRRTYDHEEGVRSFMEDRDPNFEGK
jgi:2-(1,2-epoxy-1,2-dihydrophenyl)acetyl-CoA isomerase